MGQVQEDELRKQEADRKRLDKEEDKRMSLLAQEMADPGSTGVDLDTL